MTTQGTDRRKGLAFAGAVAVLAAVGVYLTMSPSTGGGDRDRTETVAGTAPATVVSSPPPAAAPSQVAVTPGTFDVYRYLPLSRSELGAAADLAQRFTASYGTFEYSEDPAAFASRLNAFSTNEFGEQLTRAMTDPAVVEQNKADRVVSKGSAQVESIRDMTPNMVVFVVGSVRHVIAQSGEKDQNDQYAVTVVKAAADWRVYDMQPAGAGQDGDTSP
ncbi:hypothetical protein GCM10023194_72260 [Planotetraspora phitsanulokensis]|uniref:Uncharacterized protein n=1 Tax=Planotetraspora phitsanulokensis TaxID=575192 RepID=A0A8J3UDY8_9ACTN|nr:hypothetical protein [Planotetraspora phitsanulokensis]GII37275.1 hypothetical protein Pph01_22780 [Planotetraspora phitsanulokensis]